MRVVIVSLALLLPVSSSGSVDHEVAKSQTTTANPRKLGLYRAHKRNKELGKGLWTYSEMCHAQLPFPSNDSTSSCVVPSGESCFDQLIDYKYVPSRQPFPQEYEVLKGLPECWEVLRPMLCGIIYRPCNESKFIDRNLKVGKMDVYQRFSVGECTRVREHCEDAIYEGVFPSELIDCSRTAKNDIWTNENCTLRYSASRPEPMQCIFPLVYTSHERIRPLIDQCFMPCRNPLISSPDQFLSFRIFRALICFGLAMICMGIFFFLAVRSDIFVNSDVIFAIACCMLSFAVYLICWGTGSIGPLAELSECKLAAHGVAIRNTLMDSKWCWLTSVVSHVSLLASIGFLAAAYALNAASATKAAARENEKEDEIKSDDPFSRPGVRFYLVAGVVLVSIVIGIIAFGLSMASTDGIAGVCSVGLHSILDHLTVVAVPGLLYCAIALVWAARNVWSERKNREAEISQAIEEEIVRERATKKIEYLSERGPHWKEEVQAQIRGGQLPQCEEEGGAGKERREEITMLRADDDDEHKWISEERKRQIGDSVRAQKEEEWRGRKQKAWHEGVSRRYTLRALCLCIVSLIFGLFVHYAKLANEGGMEAEAVHGYVTCVMRESIRKNDTRWLHESAHAAEKWRDGAAEADPLESRRDLASGEIDIHSCAYPTTGDGRMLGLLFVFIFFPLVPVTVFIWAFFAGLAGFGGMTMVKKRRPKVKKRKYDEEEMIELTMMSGAVASRANDDARSVLSRHTMLSGAASSCLDPPSEIIGRVSIRNARAFLRRAARLVDERGAGVQHQVQLLQEELVLRTLAEDDEESEQQEEIWGAEWRDHLSEVRNWVGHYTQHDVYHEAANRGMLLLGMAVQLATLANRHDTLNYRSVNYEVLQLALEFTQRLLYIFLEELELPQKTMADTVADLDRAISVMRGQMQMNQRPDAIALLNQQARQAQRFGGFDVYDEERMRLRNQIYQHLDMLDESPSEEEWAELRAEERRLVNEMLAATNRRYVLRLVDAAADAEAAAQQLQQISGFDQPPPDYGMGAHSQAGSSHSTVLTSALSTHEQEAARIQYLETHRLQPGYDRPSTSRGAAAAAADRTGLSGFAADVMRANGRSAEQTAAACARERERLRPAPTSSSATDGFRAAVMRANGRSAEQTAAAYERERQRFLPASTARSNDLNGAHAACHDHDYLGSEMNSMGRLTEPAETRRAHNGFFLETVEVHRPPAASAVGQLQQPQQAANVPRLFPFLTANGAAVPTVPLFPGARPMGPLYEQRAASPDTASASPSAPEAAEDTSLPVEYPEVPNCKPMRRSDNRRKKRKAVAMDSEEASSCQESRRKRSHDDDSPSLRPPAVNRVYVQEQPGSSNRLMAGLSAAAARGSTEEEGIGADSGVDSLASHNLHNFRLIRIGEGGVATPATLATPQEQRQWAELMERAAGAARQRDVRPRASARGSEDVVVRDEWRRGGEEEGGEEEAGPSNEEERRRERMRLRNQYLNHSDPDLAIEEEERARRRDEERERERREKEEEEQRERIVEARERQRRERGEVVVDEHAEPASPQHDDVSISSLLTPEEQSELVSQLRDALSNLPTDGMEPEYRRLVEHLRLALDTQGGISREEIMRYRGVDHNRDRQTPDRNSPYSVSSIVISDMSLAEIGVRANAIRALSASTLYPLEVYYQLHLADVLWPLTGRDVMRGHNVYTHDEINRVLGADSPRVPADADSDDFHQLMRKRAITAASLIGRAYGRRRETEGPRYEPPRLPDMGLYRTFQDPTVVMAAIAGDLEPIRQAIASIELTMPDVMRLDNRSEHTLGRSLVHFRDFLDERAARGHPLRREDADDANEVPQEPTGSRQTHLKDVNNEEEGRSKDDPVPENPPASDPEL